MVTGTGDFLIISKRQVIRPYSHCPHSLPEWVKSLPYIVPIEGYSLRYVQSGAPLFETREFNQERDVGTLGPIMSSPRLGQIKRSK